MERYGQAVAREQVDIKTSSFWHKDNMSLFSYHCRLPRDTRREVSNGVVPGTSESNRMFSVCLFLVTPLSATPDPTPTSHLHVVAKVDRDLNDSQAHFRHVLRV